MKTALATDDGDERRTMMTRIRDALNRARRVKPDVPAEEHAGAARDALGTFAQGHPLPASAERHHYGGARTIHQTGTIDIQLDDDTGEIIAVWFRCLKLPFQVSRVRERTEGQPAIAIEEITYGELP